VRKEAGMGIAAGIHINLHIVKERKKGMKRNV